MDNARLVDTIRIMMSEEHLSAYILPLNDEGEMKVVTAADEKGFDCGLDKLTEWLSDQLKDVRNPEVALDGMCHTEMSVRRLVTLLRNAGGMTLRTNLGLSSRWLNIAGIAEEAAAPMSPMASTDNLSPHERVKLLRANLRKVHADGMLMTLPEAISHVIGYQVPVTKYIFPAEAYLLVDSQRATLYIDRRCVTADILSVLLNEGIGLGNLSDVRKGLREYFEYNILLDPNEVSHTLFHSVERIIVEDSIKV